MKKMFKWLFNNDDLKSYWWHRLILVIFAFAFVIFFISNVGLFSTTDDMFRGRNGVLQWKKVATLSERITSDIKQIGSLIKYNEKVAENNRTYVLNDEPDPYYNGTVNDVYCSTELTNKYKIVKDGRDIDELYIRSLYGRNRVSSEVFEKYIKQNGIKCLVVDAYSGENSRLTFIEPTDEFQNNWSIFSPSPLRTILYFVEMISIVFLYSCLIFVVIIFAYNKIAIYIAYGSKK